MAVICVTNRPDYLADVLANVARQDHPHVSLVLVLSSDTFDDAAVAAALAPLAVPSTVLRHPGRSLGECLNLGIAATPARLVAKFDDDDLYGPRYLTDAVEAMRSSAAAVVGKHSYFAYLAGGDRTILRFPGHEHRYTTYLAGGTLLIDTARCSGVRFDDISLGEDQAFLRACVRRGQTVYASGRFHFVQRRGAHNSWVIDDQRFAQGSQAVGQGLRDDIAFQLDAAGSQGEATGK